jgi:hypothetical protein
MSNIAVMSNSKFSKKEARRIVYEKLAGALAEYKNSLKEKRFTTNLKKASNLFAGDIVKAMKKVNRKEKTKGQKSKKQAGVKTAEIAAV